MKINIIAAMCRGNGIGYRNKLPFRSRKDMQYFKSMTTGMGDHPSLEKKQAVIMGSKTWQSLPKQPLEGRYNAIVSRTMKGDNVYCSIQNALDVCRDKNIDRAWIIGGGQIYEECFANEDINKQLTRLYITHIDKDCQCDTFFPEFSSEEWREIHQINLIENDVPLRFSIYER